MNSSGTTEPAAASARGTCFRKWGSPIAWIIIPSNSPGGEQQRVALARAFMVRPPILLADEPTGNLDSANGRHILDLLIRLNSEQGTTLVLVTHDAALAAHAQRRIVLQDGRVVADESAMIATAFRIAVREARASRGKFLFVILAVALGVGSLTGVRGFSQAFDSMLLRKRDR